MARDVVFTFFGASWAHAVERGFMFSEERLAGTLLEHPAVRRLLVANPYRSVAGVAKARLNRHAEAPFPATAHAHLVKPLRLRRADPVKPARSVWCYEQTLRLAARRRGLERPAIITTNPLIAGFGDFAWAGPVTYYAFDDWAASEPHRAWWPAYAEAFARIRATGRRVAAVSPRALARVAPTGPGIVVPNGVEPEEWLELGTPPAWFAAKQRPRMLYVGSLEGRVDIDQIRAAAEAFPEGSMTLVGKLLDPSHFESLRTLPNIDIQPMVSRETVTQLIGAADVCLVPHVRNELTQAMSPLKLYEYLAGGRPVASVDLEPIREIPGRIVLSTEERGFATAVRDALALGPAPEAEREAFVAEHAWSNRYERLLAVALAD